MLWQLTNLISIGPQGQGNFRFKHSAWTEFKVTIHYLDVSTVKYMFLYMKAIHGGKTKNDKIDSFKIAKLLKGGNFPLA